MGTREVLAKEVALKELYQVDNPYKKRLQVIYDSYKSSDDYKESKLDEEDYLFASHQTRAFTYHSLNDEYLIKQIQNSKDFVLISDPYKARLIADTTGRGISHANEIDILINNGYRIETFGNYWRAIK
ncbi:hypothetical protein HO665_04635 [Streptococcus suis]|nr:hypothetical protein [Streptococcus suis]NQO46359.1 hypothetical protein [Streptococcus suis]WNF84412.1 hypothetical protein RJW52_00350 [Streptococcus suis]HEL1613153.1 hypothetical protein [Streptococcus suis]